MGAMVFLDWLIVRPPFIIGSAIHVLPINFVGARMSFPYSLHHFQAVQKVCSKNTLS